MATPIGIVEHRVDKNPKDPLLSLILQKYIQTSRDSIRGPVAVKADFRMVSKNFQDTKKVEIPEEYKLRPTMLDGHAVSGFSVGGEKRMCFTELVQSVLKDINVHDIFKKRDSLLIFTSKCSQKQLDELKYHGVLPWTTTSSNLITKSDAYRLCGALQTFNAIKADPSKRSPASFEVYHECFGGCIGVFDPELYVEVNSPCIRCTECNGLFTTRKFVSHNHASFDEVHTCHWGFDSARWRFYIMLVEQKASRELLKLWDNIKAKFDSRQDRMKLANPDQAGQDADFVAYIHSPDHKKAMVSPIENLRNQEAQIESSSRYSDIKEGGSAFRPWSPANTRRTDSRFSIDNRDQGSQKHNRLYQNQSQNHSCGCCPTSPLYMNCQQCKTAAQVGCSSGNVYHSDRHSHGDSDLKKKLDSNCNCEQCKRNISHIEDLEKSFDEIIKTYTSTENKLTTTSRDLAQLLSCEIKRLNISQDEKIREMSVGKQRLQTELHLVKMESQKKLKDSQDTRVHAEQELETLHRERQKEISIFNQMRWELSCEVNKRKSAGEAVAVDTLQKEMALIKAQLQQSRIENENLQKQLEWHVNRRKQTSENWTPYPTMARQFSDSSDNDEPDASVTKKSKPVITPTLVPASESPAKEKTNEKRNADFGHNSPASKSQKLDIEEASVKDEDTSDIEVED